MMFLVFFFFFNISYVLLGSESTFLSRLKIQDGFISKIFNTSSVFVRTESLLSSSLLESTNGYSMIIQGNSQFPNPIEELKKIKAFHEQLKEVSPENQAAMVRLLLLGNSSCQDLEKINRKTADLCQENILARSRVVTEYNKKLLSYADNEDMLEEVIADPAITSYHQFIVHSAHPEDQLYYQIKFIKNFCNERGQKLSQNIQRYLTISLIGKCQDALFEEQNKISSMDVVFKIARYYDPSISEKEIQFYYEKKQVLAQSADSSRKKLSFKLSQAILIERQKMLLMAIGLTRGFWANSGFILFAKDHDFDCGNYCIDVCVANPEEKYGALNAIKFLQQNSDALTLETINRLYPLISGENQVMDNKEIIGDKKETNTEVKPRFLITALSKLFSIIFCLPLLICKFICSFFIWVDGSRPENRHVETKHPILALKHHCSVSDAQYEKIKLQVADFKKYKQIGETSFKQFLNNLYRERDYSIDHCPEWFKYWHVKEALVANLLDLRIRIFTEKSQLKEVTQQEPCYDEKSREVYVWTDNKALHDSELVPFYCFSLMAKAVRHENKYFRIEAQSYDWFIQSKERFEQYKKDWLK